MLAPAARACMQAILGLLCASVCLNTLIFLPRLQLPTPLHLLQRRGRRAAETEEGGEGSRATDTPSFIPARSSSRRATPSGRWKSTSLPSAGALATTRRCARVCLVGAGPRTVDRAPHLLEAPLGVGVARSSVGYQFTYHNHKNHKNKIEIIFIDYRRGSTTALQPENTSVLSVGGSKSSLPYFRVNCRRPFRWRGSRDPIVGERGFDLPPPFAPSGAPYASGRFRTSVPHAGRA